MQQTQRHRNRRFWPAFGIGLAVCLFLYLVPGCGDGKKDTLNRLSPRSMPYLTGVAVPEGFTLDDDVSEDHESGAVRSAQHVYKGSADRHAIRTFYREQMPLLGWDYVDGQQSEGRITLRFEKHSEVCTVEIEDGGFLGRTKILVIVKPFHRSPAEPPRRRLP